jgi:hypothetical protein
MAMLRFMIISFLISSSTYLFSSQPETKMFTRGYACYFLDPLRQAISKGDLHAMEENVSCIPTALEAQYGLITLTKVDKVKICVIEMIKADWMRRMSQATLGTIESFISDYARLVMPWSCCRGAIDRDFMIMLDDLRTTMRQVHAQNPRVLEAVARMPHLNQPRALTSLIGIQIVKELKKREQDAENIDRNAFLASLPEDLRAILAKYMTPPSSR